MDKDNAKLTREFKVFLDKRKEKILKIQEIKTKKIYFPAKFQGPTIMMNSLGN